MFCNALKLKWQPKTIHTLGPITTIYFLRVDTKNRYMLVIGWETPKLHDEVEGV